MEALERVTHEFTYESGPSRVGQTIGHSPRPLQMYRAGHGGLSLYRRHKADDASGKTGGSTLPRRSASVSKGERREGEVEKKLL